MSIDLQILNILINNQKELNDFASSVGENVFEIQNRRFVRSLIGYHTLYKSCPTLNTLIEFAGSNNVDLREYLTDKWETIEQFETDHREYTFLLEKLNSRYNKIILTSVRQQLNEATLDDDLIEMNGLLVKAQNEIANMKTQKVYKEVTLKDSVDDWYESFKAKQASPEIAQGLMTGFSIMDYYTNGLRPGELLLFGADTGYGKSIFLAQLATNCIVGKNAIPETSKEIKEKTENNTWNKTYNVLYVTLEMGYEEIQNRILSCMASVDSLDLDKGYLKENDGKNIAVALSYWKHGPSNLKIIDAPRGCSMSMIQGIYDECCLNFKPDIVIIDYLGLMVDNSGDANADWLKLKDVSEQMHEFGRANGVVVASAVQVTDVEAGKGTVGMHRIGRSRMIGHNANIFLQLDVREDEDNRNDARIVCVKFRRGPKFVMNNLRKEFQYTRFLDLGFTPEASKNKIIGAVEDLTEIMSKIFDQEDEQ